MAEVKEITIKLYDDFDGTEGAETLFFAFDGLDYSVDLTKRNKREFHRMILPYITAGRPVKHRRNGKVHTNGNGNGRRVQINLPPYGEVRAWALSKGIDVSPIGRVSNEVVEKWRKAT